MSIFRTKPVTLNRISGGVYTNGMWVEGSPTTSTVMCSVQPMTDHDMQMLPSGRRESKAYVVFTDTELFEVGTQNPDLVTIDGETFEVVRSAPWRNNIINHYKYYVVKLS